eukprot:scaffold7729_cov50-Cyclotella_meneghiniana.AAC.4
MAQSYAVSNSDESNVNQSFGLVWARLLCVVDWQRLKARHITTRHTRSVQDEDLFWKKLNVEVTNQARKEIPNYPA